MEVHKPKFVKGLIAEIFVIVIGISLAVIAERIVEHYQHRKEAKGVIARMIAELRRDSVDLAFNQVYHTKAAEADSIMTKWSRHELELSADSITYYANNTLNYTFFASNTSEIETLKGSGKLYLIENEELLSTILKHYDRYVDFKLFTDLSINQAEQIGKMYKENSSLQTVADLTGDGTIFHFDGKSLQDNLRGNRVYENLLQEKWFMDKFTIQRYGTALKRTIRIMNQLKEEIN